MSRRANLDYQRGTHRLVGMVVGDGHGITGYSTPVSDSAAWSFQVGQRVVAGGKLRKPFPTRRSQSWLLFPPITRVFDTSIPIPVIRCIERR